MKLRTARRIVYRSILHDGVYNQAKNIIKKRRKMQRENRKKNRKS